MTATIHDFDPAAGQAFQGDIAIVPIPRGVRIDRSDEIAPRDGRLILQEGEVSGHHHAIRLRHFRDERRVVGDPVLATRDRELGRAPAGGRATATARLFRDPAAVQALVRRRILTRADLAIGCLVVQGGPVTVSHEEHDGICLPPGAYYVGRQVERAGVAERPVSD
jgi:hypothetical protein